MPSQGPQKVDQPLAQRLSGRAAIRSREEVPHGVPVALRSAQHVTISRGRFEPFAARRVVLIEWVISGEAAMMAAGKMHTFKPGQVAVYLPTTPMQFWAVAPVSEMCWFTVDGPSAEPMAIQLELQSGVYPCGAPPVRTIHRMMHLLKDHTIHGWRRASLAAIELMYDVANCLRTPQTPSVVRAAQQFIQQNFSDPNLSINSLAAELNYHRGSLSRLFHQQTGSTIVDYIAQVRLQESTALLQHTDDKVAEVARKCGFRDTGYFCRWLRKHSGQTASSLREHVEK
jgi:AraC-like DNA-binding protein